jgi:hypothetical protein
MAVASFNLEGHNIRRIMGLQLLFGYGQLTNQKLNSQTVITQRIESAPFLVDTTPLLYGQLRHAAPALLGTPPVHATGCATRTEA